MPDNALAVNDAPAAERPLTFEQAFAQDESPTSDPAPEAPVADPAVPGELPTTVPGQTTGEDTTRSPFIPRSRFDEVNTKLNELKAWRESRAWAEQVQPEHFQQMAAWYLRAQSDPREFALKLLDEMAQSPEHAQAIRSELAKRLGTPAAAPTTQAPDTMPDPDVAITDGNGNIVGRTYSADLLAQRDAIIARQVLQGVDAKYAPHLKTLESITAREAQLAQQQQADQFAGSFVSELATLPLFKEHQAEIGAVLKTMPLTSDSPDAVKAATYQAYHRVVGPKLLAGSQQAVVADLQRKKAASSGVNPSTMTAATSKRPWSFYDLTAEAWKE